MKKNLAIVLALAFVLSIAGTAFAAPNPFVDVPAKHWAYDSINTLVKNKVIDGFGDGTYRGDKTLTRYEVAVIVAKAMAKSDKMNAESKAAVDKLQVEFAAELQNLGVRVEKLEKNASSVKITGVGFIRYQKNNFSAAHVARETDAAGTSRWNERIRLQLTADINENTKFLGQIRADNQPDRFNRNAAGPVSATGNLYFERAEVAYKNGNFSTAAGRTFITLGQGLIYDGNPIDGGYVKFTSDNNKFSVMAGVGDVDATAISGNTLNASFANMTAKVGSNVDLSLAYLKSMNSTAVLGGNPWLYKQFAYGAKVQMGDFRLYAEGIKNDHSDLPANAQKTGWWTRLQYKAHDLSKPGTFRIYADYVKLGNYAIDSNTWAHTLPIAGGNGNGRDGMKGYGIGFNYVWAKNVDIQAHYYSTKPYDPTVAGYNSYKSTYHIINNFRF